MRFTVYLSGEIHTEWRNEIQQGAEKYGIDIEFVSAVTDHDASDSAGDHLGTEDNPFWRDHKSAKVNAIRTKTLIEKSDMAVIRFGNKYKQWNAAFDAGFAAALRRPFGQPTTDILTALRGDGLHPLGHDLDQLRL